MTAASPIEIVSTSIANHVARVVLADPLPSTPDDLVQNRLLEAAWRALREHPAEGPIRLLEVWAPPGLGAAPQRVLRREFKEALEVPPPVSIRPGTAHPSPHFGGLGEKAESSQPLEEFPHGLRPLGEFLVIPDGLAVRLRSRGIDTANPQLTPLVKALLAEAGYDVTARKDEGRIADLEGVSSDAGRVVVRCYHSDEHVLPPTIDRFAYAFLSTRADEAFFITDGLLPFESRHWERDPRIHLLDRVGLQRLIEAVAARVGGISPARP